MNKISSLPFAQCGDTFQPTLPEQWSRGEPPILLGSVAINPKFIERPHVLLKFSEFFQFTLVGLSPKLKITYRLSKEVKNEDRKEILNEWEFQFAAAEEDFGNLDTNQPTVLNYCDRLDKEGKNSTTYRIEIIEIQRKNVKRLDITNTSFTATVISGQGEPSRPYNGNRVRRYPSKLHPSIYEISRMQHLQNGNPNNPPFIGCGKTFNPVLPQSLNRGMAPVLLAEVTVNTQKTSQSGTLLTFSSFIKSILRQDHFNHLKFRLVRICLPSGKRDVLMEWPFLREFPSDTDINEPLVYNFCDRYTKTICKYRMELVEARLSVQSSFDISNKSLTAQVFNYRHGGYELFKGEGVSHET
ncbi:DUF4489 domain-containing protein [Halobacillus yeomjeoni]|uniref:DUF4489 domain-containing protein n=1 Tax=Halobacillus yeomjeoni TaxID=311194 RepID=UPI001CD3981F|nr:DUF4489 domain-containing protein [Halobacillus yeomjeoni]MCA0982926.1 DUF4489 domain-containing protein [Halobacillus yeomjeoni]